MIYIIWVLAGIFFLICDFKKHNVLFLSFAYCSIFCATLIHKYHIDYSKQILAFVCFLPVVYFLIKLIYKVENREIADFKMSDEIINKKVTVKKDIAKPFSIDGIGLVEYDNRLWKAKSIYDKEIKAGQTVEVVSKENLILNVKPLEETINADYK